MPSELDRNYDEVLAEVTGPGGRLAIGQDEQGRAIVTNLPATLPAFFDAFCALHAANEAVVAGEERLTFAELDRISETAGARAGRARASPRATGSRIAMRNCPAWIVGYMAIAQGGRRSPPCSTAGGKPRDGACAQLTEPKLIIADAPRAKRIAERVRRHATSSACRSSGRSRRRCAVCWNGATKAQLCPRLRRRTTPPSCSPRARPASQGRGLDPPRGHHRRPMPMRPA